jgi:hypothetical protein
VCRSLVRPVLFHPPPPALFAWGAGGGGPRAQTVWYGTGTGKLINKYLFFFEYLSDIS